MTIWANCIVNNEENFIWFALMSVVDHVDKILVWDTGSDDKTVEIIKEIIKIKRDKIKFKEVGSTDKYEFTKMRQVMLDESKCDWILILDGDEIWWEDSIKKVVQEINNHKTDIAGIVVPMIIPVGDIYHFQEQKAGKYELLGCKGHYSLKVINRKISGLHVDLPYGKEGYYDDKNVPIQKREGIVHVDAPYLHTTHLRRSTKVREYDKYKYELGERFSKDFKYPEVLLKPFPEIVFSPWNAISGLTKLRAQVLTPLRKIKRRLG